MDIHQLWERDMNELLNSKKELTSLAVEFEGSISLADATYSPARNCVINAARNLLQTSTSQYSVVIPDRAPSIECGHGSGEWVTALVFLDNASISRNSSNTVTWSFYSTANIHQIASISSDFANKIRDEDDAKIREEWSKFFKMWLNNKISCQVVERSLLANVIPLDTDYFAA